MTKTFRDKCGNEITGIQAHDVFIAKIVPCCESEESQQENLVIFDGHICNLCQRRLKDWLKPDAQPAKDQGQ